MDMVIREYLKTRRAKIVKARRKRGDSEESIAKWLELMRKKDKD